VIKEEMIREMGGVSLFKGRPFVQQSLREQRFKMEGGKKKKRIKPSGDVK